MEQSSWNFSCSKSMLRFNFCYSISVPVQGWNLFRTFESSPGLKRQLDCVRCQLLVKFCQLCWDFLCISWGIGAAAHLLVLKYFLIYLAKERSWNNLKTCFEGFMSPSTQPFFLFFLKLSFQQFPIFAVFEYVLPKFFCFESWCG